MCAQQAWPGRGHYDVILCLGLTKWLHLQSGDVGVVRLFSRAYQSLAPGGLFILAAQPWSSYNRSKRTSVPAHTHTPTHPSCSCQENGGLTVAALLFQETTFHHFRTVRLKPDQFTSYLTENVGFSSYRLLAHTGMNTGVHVCTQGCRGDAGV